MMRYVDRRWQGGCGRLRMWVLLGAGMLPAAGKTTSENLGQAKRRGIIARTWFLRYSLQSRVSC